MTKTCKYANICKGYSNESHTCQHDSEADGYCGYYVTFKEYRVK